MGRITINCRNMKLQKFITDYWILVLLIVIKLILQYVLVNQIYEPHRDEYLYLNQADHLAFGYISVPPFCALVSKLIFFLGGGIFWVKFFPAIFGAFTIVFTWLIVESLGGNLVAKTVAACGVVFSLLVRINILFQPNSFDILAWTMVFYFLIKFFQTENAKWIFLSAIIMAAGFYNKYNMIFLVAGLVAGLLLTSRRKIFKYSNLWIALGICLIILSPNIIWQVVHHFPVFQHMKVLKENQLDNNSAAGFLISQVMFFIGSIPLTTAALVAFIFFKPFRDYRFIGITVVVILLIFALMKAKDYYAVGIFPVLIAFGAVFYEKVKLKSPKLLLPGILIGLNLAIFILTIRLVYPVYKPAEIISHSDSFKKLGLLRWEDGKNHALPQDFADMLGWKEMAEKSKEAYSTIPADERDMTLIFCDNYGETGALNYFNRGKMPQAYSFNTDYIFWLPRLNKIRNIVFVGNKPSNEVLKLFKEVKLYSEVDNQYAREYKTGIFLLTGADDNFTSLFYKKAEERIKNFDIF